MLHGAAMKYPEKIFNTTSGIVMIFNGDGAIVWINDACMRTLGYPLSALQKTPPWPFVTDDDGKKITAIIHQAQDGNSPDPFDIKVRCTDKSMKQIRWNTLLVCDDENSSQKSVVFWGTEHAGKKSKQTKLEAAEECYRLFFENVGVGMMYVGEDSIIALVNKEFETLTGYTGTEAEGRMCWTTLVADEDDLKRMTEFHRLRGIDPALAPTSYNAKLKHKNGDVLDVVIHITMVPGSSYRLVSFLGMTEERNAQKVIRESEAKYRSLVDNIPDALYRCDTKGNIIFINPAGAHLLGYNRPEEIIGKNMADDFYFSRDLRVAFLEKLTVEGKVTNHEETLKNRCGLPIFISTNSHLFYDRGGNVLGVEGLFTDITQRKIFEDKFTKVFMMTPDCIVITRASDGTIIDVNVGFEEITGWQHDEVIGRTASEMNFWAKPEERALMVEELNAGRDVIHREMLFRRKDRSLRTGIYSTRFINIAGELNIILLIQDITDQRRLEKERRKLEQQLHQSQKMDAIGELASGVAHDFNNILTGIQGNASLMKMSYESEHPHYQKLSRIEESVIRGAKLTQQLLGFARGGKYEVKTLSMNDLVRKTVLFFLEAKKEIEADFQLQKDAYPVDADAGQMEQVLLNIYINAGHAMPEGGLLYIKTGNVTLQETDAHALEIPPGDYVRISISDTGTGMDQPTLKRIFEPFFTTKSSQGGTGLGLASAYGIMRNHGGAIHADSECGRGSTFHLYFPSSRKEVTHERRSTSAGLIPGSGNILLVDDDPMILSSASEMLNILGYTVFQAGSGQEAVSIYIQKNRTIDLVILDMILPGINGTQVLKMIQEINPDVRVILSSGYSLQGEVQKVMEAGCRGFIQKPFMFADLSNIVHKNICSS